MRGNQEAAEAALWGELCLLVRIIVSCFQGQNTDKKFIQEAVRLSGHTPALYRMSGHLLPPSRRLSERLSQRDSGPKDTRHTEARIPH